jgi:hypothetical protein
MFDSAKTPIATLGSARLNPAVMPAGLTSR